MPPPHQIVLELIAQFHGCFLRDGALRGEVPAHVSLHLGVAACVEVRAHRLLQLGLDRGLVVVGYLLSQGLLVDVRVVTYLEVAAQPSAANSTVKVVKPLLRCEVGRLYHDCLPRLHV